MKGQLNWLTGGIALGLVFFLAVAVTKPIGVSTQFVIADAWLLSPFVDGLVEPAPENKSGYGSTNAYLNRSGGKYAAAAADPINYSFVFVLAMIVGAGLSSRLGGPRPSPRDQQAPKVWRERFGASLTRRYSVAFLGGVFVLFGARLAGGCTSGHMMSGMMQTALSGYLFSAGVFAVSVPLALWLFGRR